MTGSLQVKRGYYYVILNYRDSNGCRKQKWIATYLKEKGNKRKAQEILNEVIMAYADTEYIEPDKSYFSTFIEGWLETHKTKIQVSTYDGYKHMLEKHIKPYFEEKKIVLTKLKPVDIEKYYWYCMEVNKLSSNTVCKHHQLIHKCLEDAVKNRYVKENIANYVEKPKQRYVEKSFLEDDELEQLLQIFKGEKIEIAVVLAIYFGLRRSEILGGVTWDKIDFEKNTIKISSKAIRTKDDSGKMTILISDDLKTDSSYAEFPLCSTVRDYLLKTKKQIEKNKDFFGTDYCYDYENYICVDEKGYLLKPDYISKRFSVVAKRNGFNDISFHSLRHSCGSMLLHLGFDIKDIQKWLRHSNYQTTANIYVHNYNNAKRNMLDAISNSLQRNQTKTKMLDQC